MADVPKLTKEQAAIVGAYTGILAGPFSDVHAYAERVLGRPIWTHQFASRDVVGELKLAAKADFLAMLPNGTPLPTHPNTGGNDE